MAVAARGSWACAWPCGFRMAGGGREGGGERQGVGDGIPLEGGRRRPAVADGGDAALRRRALGQQFRRRRGPRSRRVRRCRWP